VKVGAENRTKLIAAVALGVIALVALASTLGGFFGGGAATSASTSPASPAMPSAAELSNQPVRATRSSTKYRPGEKKQNAGQSLDPTLHYDLLRTSEDTKYQGTGRNIFRVFVEPPPRIIQNPVISQTPVQQGPQQPPPPPPINLKFYGFATPTGGTKRIFLAQDEDVFIAKEGDIVNRRYKVVRISPNAVEILDVLSNNRQSIPLTQG